MTLGVRKRDVAPVGAREEVYRRAIFLLGNAADFEKTWFGILRARNAEERERVAHNRSKTR